MGDGCQLALDFGTLTGVEPPVVASWQTVGGAPLASVGPSRAALHVFGGTPHVVYERASTGALSVVSHDDATGWATVGAPGFATADVGRGGPDVAVYDGDAYVAFLDAAADLHLYRYDGVAWSEYDAALPAVYLAQPRDGSQSGSVSVQYADGSGWTPVGQTGFTGSASDVFDLEVYGSTPYVLTETVDPLPILHVYE